MKILLRKSEIPGIRKGVYAGKDSESVRLKIGNGIGWITEAGDNIRLFGIPVNTFWKRWFHPFQLTTNSFTIKNLKTGENGRNLRPENDQKWWFRAQNHYRVRLFRYFRLWIMNRNENTDRMEPFRMFYSDVHVCKCAKNTS